MGKELRRLTNGSRRGTQRYDLRGFASAVFDDGLPEARGPFVSKPAVAVVFDIEATIIT
jgi:hypothetical protein